MFSESLSGPDTMIRRIIRPGRCIILVIRGRRRRRGAASAEQSPTRNLHQPSNDMMSLEGFIRSANLTPAPSPSCQARLLKAQN